MHTSLTLHEIREAAKRIAPHAHRTPVLTCRTLDELAGTKLYFKCENFQRVGAFKFRGACNAVFSLSDDEAKHGVVTHSSGNHAQALALAARMRGIRAFIVMPRNARAVKQAAVAGYGGEITLCEPTLEARESTTQRIIEQTGAILIHPYNDSRIIAGQATAAMELIEEVSDLELIVAPVGGGGLLSGTALAARYLLPDARVIGAEPDGADDAARSIKEGRIVPSLNPSTVADGLLTSLGELTFSIIRDYVAAIVTVDDAAILKAMRLVWERMKIVIEPSAAVPLAVILEKEIHVDGKRVGVIFSGGNVDFVSLASVIGS